MLPYGIPRNSRCCRGGFYIRPWATGGRPYNLLYYNTTAKGLATLREKWYNIMYNYSYYLHI